ncbi:hypothetical protein ABEB36_009473 [Hypothenemus hampei]|uniref:BESS domain-containing protein n=1 Tax=Hypothenemus hampei TaxID=57062 RepID=A0ABD1EGG3_HYPHA
MAAVPKLSENDTIKFVGLYKGCEVLWNIRHEHYKNRDKRNSAFEYIQREMNMQGLRVDFIKKKKRKIKLKKVLSLEHHLMKFIHHGLFGIKEAAIFLDFCTGRKSSSNIVSSVTIESRTKDTNNLNVTHGEDSSTQSFMQPQSNNVTGSTSANKRRKSNDTVPQHIAIAMEKLEQLKNSSMEKDEFDYFAMNIARQLRSLSLERALKCQLEFQNILMKERLEYEKQKSESFYSSHSSYSVSAVSSPLT